MGANGFLMGVCSFVTKYEQKMLPCFLRHGTTHWHSPWHTIQFGGTKFCKAPTVPWILPTARSQLQKVEKKLKGARAPQFIVYMVFFDVFCSAVFFFCSRIPHSWSICQWKNRWENPVSTGFPCRVGMGFSQLRLARLGMINGSTLPNTLIFEDNTNIDREVIYIYTQ